MKTTKCKEVKEIEDECSVMAYSCEKDEGHEGSHLTHYMGQWGKVEIPVYWNTDNSAIKFYRNGQVNNYEE